MIKFIKYYVIKFWLLIQKLFKKTDIDNKIFEHFAKKKIQPYLEKNWYKKDKLKEFLYKKTPFSKETIEFQIKGEFTPISVVRELIRIYNKNL